MEVRPAEQAEIDQLARLWHDGWQDAHAGILPAELARLRTLENFAERLAKALGDTFAIGPVGAPLGLHMLKGDELYQFYVAAQARGRGVAPVLIADAEARLSQRGVKTAWLACAVGNERAARFYEKAGWHRARTMVNNADTSAGPFPVEIWRYEKVLAP